MLNSIALFCGQRSEARSDPPNASTSAWKAEIRIHLYTAACGKEDTLAIKSIDQLFLHRNEATQNIHPSQIHTKRMRTKLKMACRQLVLYGFISTIAIQI